MATTFIDIVRKPDYSDLDLDFIAHPTTGDVMKKTGHDAIKRSIRNLIFTNFMDRVFQPSTGGNVKGQLFENFSNIARITLENSIKDVIKRHEPRVNLDKVTVNVNEDNNGFDVEIYYTIVNTNQKVGIGLFLERIR